MEFAALGDIHGDYASVRRNMRQHPEIPFSVCVGDVADAQGRYESYAAPLFWIVVWVVEVNHAARAFYRRVGLQPDGARRVDRLAGEPVPVVRYAGTLNRVDLGGLLR